MITGIAPAPWKARKENDYMPAQISDETRYLIADIYGSSREQRAAHAQLMAAAPDLLTQLEALVVQIEASGRLTVPPGVTAAIAKAKGRS